MKRLYMMPRGTRQWRRFLLRWSILALLLVGGTMSLTIMPGSSYSGRLPPLAETEVLLRDRLREHVAVLAGDIGERNLWYYRELWDAAQYVEDRLTEAGYTIERQDFQYRGKRSGTLRPSIQGVPYPRRSLSSVPTTIQ